MTFERPHHQAIATVLYALDGELLRQCSCLFGGGTAIALRFGEYRESVDMDFLVSDLGGFRQLRSLLTAAGGVAGITHDKAQPLVQAADLRADQYGLRTRLLVAGHPIKFEIVHEARITLAQSGADDVLCNVSTLTLTDMVASKLLANSDRWRDNGVFSRDAIDLAMINPDAELLRQAMEKAALAYGSSIRTDLDAALDKLLAPTEWLERCMQAMHVSVAKALLWQRLRNLQSRLQKLA